MNDIPRIFSTKQVKAYLIVFVTLCTQISPTLGQNTCTSNGTGGGDWDFTSTWSCTGGATVPDATVNTINILAGDDVNINDLFEGTYFSGAVTINISGTLSFGLPGSLALPTSSVINVAAGGIIDAGDFFGSDNVGAISIGSLLNLVWFPAFGIGSGDLVGPGSLDGSSSGVLPILLITFGAEAGDNNVKLIWLTAAEENNDFFTIERSRNGVDFQEIATIRGAGTSFDALEYDYIDKNPLQGVSYYRLKQTDYDGTSETFKVIAVEFYGDIKPIKITQRLGSYEKLSIYSNLDEGNTAYIYDMMGRGGSVGSLQVGENLVDLTQLNVQGGMYVIKIVNALGNVLATQKFVVQ